MANITNPWLTAYQRSYNQIKASILSTLSQRMPEITDYTEGNIFILIISIFSGIAEVLHYYIDNLARETFFPTAMRFSSLLKHAALVDYNIKLAIPSTCDLILYLSNGEAINTNITIPINTIFNSDDGKIWISTKSVVFMAGTYSCSIPVKQWEDKSQQSLGTYNGSTIYLQGTTTDGKRVAEGSVVLYINGEPWTLVDTFANRGPQDKVFKVSLGNNQVPYIVFGDGQFGKKPYNGSILSYSCKLTYGASGNIAEGSFSTVPNSISNLQDNLAITNIDPASGGSNYEDFNMLRDHIPLSVKTLGVAITKEDYEAIAKLIPGVNKAFVIYDCIRWVTIYITPDAGSVASQSLIDEVTKRFDTAKVVTTTVEVISTQECYIYLEAEIMGRKSYNATDIDNQVKQALISNYSYDTSDVNKIVRISDIYAIIDNCSMVDYANIKKLYLLSAPLVENNINNPDPSLRTLNITNYVLNEFNLELFYTEENGVYTPTEENPNNNPYFQLELNVQENNGEVIGKLNFLTPNNNERVPLGGSEWNTTSLGNFKLNIWTTKYQEDNVNTPYISEPSNVDYIQFNNSYNIRLLRQEGNSDVTEFNIDITISNYGEGNINYQPGYTYIINIQPDALNLLRINQTMDLTPLDYNMPLFNSNTINLTIHEVV